MKIRTMQWLFLRSSYGKNLGNSLAWLDGKAANILKIETEEGITGYGEGYQTYGPQHQQLVQALKSLFADFKGFRFESWEDIEKKFQQTAKCFPSAVEKRIESALNMAFWDLKGKAENCSVCQLFGCRPQKKVPVYGTGLFYREVSDYKEQLPFFLEEMQGFIDAGYHGIKMKAGRYPVDQEVWLIERIREALPPNMNLMVDANCGMKSTEETLELMKYLYTIGAKWLEEPFRFDSYSQYETICRQRNKLDIAGGEHESDITGFQKLLKSGITILQPELSLCGGFLQVANLINMAREYHVQATPHVWGSGVQYSAALHFYSMLGPEHNMLFECPFLTDPLRDDCFTHLVRTNGFLDTPSGPGLGAEVNEEKFKKYVVDII